MSEKFSRPATLEDLKTLISTLNQCGAEYLLIGGYALFLHGYYRATTDIDLLVPASEEAGTKVRAALMLLPDQVARDIDPAWFAAGENVRVADEFVVDVMCSAGAQTYETLKKYAETIDFHGLPIRTVNLEGLYLSKQTARDKDAPDRAIIERALRELGWKPEAE